MSEYFVPHCKSFKEAANTAKARREALEFTNLNNQVAAGIENPSCSITAWQKCASCGQRAYSTTANGEFLSTQTGEPTNCAQVEEVIQQTLAEACILKRTLLQLAALDRKSHSCPANGCSIVVNGQTGEISGTDNCTSIQMDQTNFTGCNMIAEGICQDVINTCYAIEQLTEQGLDKASFPDAESTERLMKSMVRVAYESGCTTFKSTKSDFQ